MNRHCPSICRFSGLALLCLSLLAGAPAPARATVRAPYTVEVLVDGKPLHRHHARGTTYIEAREGAEYSIRLRNRTGERVAIALSVDGLNTIDAKTTSARSGSKWILGPYGTITLDGWQTSASTARRFFFTSEQQSYGAWLGKTENLGIISAAVFREKRRRVAQRMTPGAGESQARPSAPGRDATGKARAMEESAELSDEMAATGIGEEMQHDVQRVRFEAEARPASVIELRYEYHDALVRLGVLPRHHALGDDPLERRERARGFDDGDFAPDPYR